MFRIEGSKSTYFQYFLNRPGIIIADDYNFS